jgi:hypothetical protein
VEQVPQPDHKFDSDTRQSQAEWTARYRSRERRKLVGVLVIVLLILALAFLRFGKTIPWGAR